MSESETESPLGSPSAATSAATAAAAAEVPMQSPLMAALLQVGAATQATIDSATDQIRERLSGSNDALQKIIDNNFEEFEARTSRIQEDHEALKAHADSRFVRAGCVNRPILRQIRRMPRRSSLTVLILCLHAVHHLCVPWLVVCPVVGGQDCPRQGERSHELRV